MSPDSPTHRRMSLARDFLLSFTAFALFAIVVCAIVLQLKTSGDPIELARDPFWGLAKWYLLDILATMAALGIPAALLAIVLHGVTRKQAIVLSRWKRVVAVVLALLFGLGVVNYVVDQHPIFIDTMRLTDYPSSPTPDHVVLTWAGDPKTTQAIQWRTGEGVTEGRLRYRRANTAAPWNEADSTVATFDEPRLITDQNIQRHTVALDSLSPGTAYEYQIADGDNWLPQRTFTTAPAEPEPFTFVYLGDSQEGLLDHGMLIETTVEKVPDAAFYLHAGDLVNRGCDRDDWDLFFHASRNVYDRYTVVPAIGNHDDCDPLDPRLYTAFLALPEIPNTGVPPENAYAFNYSNASFVVLNSNKNIAEQAPWLEEQLKNSTATWKFALWHHPAYASKPNRDDPEIRKHWIPLIDKYDVDVVFQGHDHAYMRTKPLRGGEIVDSPDEGTIYLVSNSGTKNYDQVERDYIEVGFEDVMSYQTIRIDGGKFAYEAIDASGKVIDAFTLSK